MLSTNAEVYIVFICIVNNMCFAYNIENSLVLITLLRYGRSDYSTKSLRKNEKKIQTYPT